MSEILVPVPESVLPPKESYRYFPPSEYIFKGKPKKCTRYVIENQKLTEFEQEKLNRLLLEIKKAKIEIPLEWSENFLIRFCYGGGWKTNKSLKTLVAHLDWRKNVIPRGYKMLYPKVIHLLNTGAFYIHGRDERYRPLLIMNLSKINFKKVSFN